jgi:N-acetylmuramidase/Putative peptidoglycan binding domain
MLKLGSTGRAVGFLQARLGSVAVTGTFDGPTQAALRAVQGARGLAADGIYGPATNAAMTARAPNAIAGISAQLGLEARALAAVVQVESSGAGFFTDGRPVILLERHYVWARASVAARTTLGPALCNPTPGGYVGGTGEWDRFEQVAAVCGDEIAAQSCSWGLGQVMGANYALAGCAIGAQMMYRAARNETEQLTLMASFIAAQPGVRNALAQHDWPTFARLYNGPNFAANQYDTKLAAAYAALA